MHRIKDKNIKCDPILFHQKRVYFLQNQKVMSQYFALILFVLQSKTFNNDSKLCLAKR